MNDSYAGGSFAPETKFAGYDAIIIVGKASKPTVVTIRNDVVEFVPAEPKYWGMKTSEIEQAIRDDFDPEAKTCRSAPPARHSTLGVSLDRPVPQSRTGWHTAPSWVPRT